MCVCDVCVCVCVCVYAQVIDEADRLLTQRYQDWVIKVLSAVYNNMNGRMFYNNNNNNSNSNGYSIYVIVIYIYIC